jgi:hypothetical protein
MPRLGPGAVGHRWSELEFQREGQRCGAKVFVFALVSFSGT